jgi:hypothetical protein
MAMMCSYTGEGINPLDDTSQKSTDWVGSTEIGNFEASGWASTSEVANFLRETIPPTHLENCRNIQYEPGPSPEYPNARGVFDCRSREISIWERFEHLQGMEDRVEPLTYQVAYNAYENINANRPDLADQWSELHDQSLIQYSRDGSGFVSSHASTDAGADFAESYTSYLHDPEKLKFYSPEKYDFMKYEVFSARETTQHTLGHLAYDHAQQKLSFGRGIHIPIEAVRELPNNLISIIERVPEFVKNPDFIKAFEQLFGHEPTARNIQEMLGNPETQVKLAKLSKSFF